MKKIIFILLLFGSLSRVAECPVLDREAQMCKISEVGEYIFFGNIYDEPFTISNLRRAIDYLDIHTPDIVYRQAILETGEFTSELFLYGNNCFGMRLARVRETTAIGIWNHHASYRHWYDSVVDYKLFQNWYESKGYELSEYLVFLEDVGYATDNRYINKLKSLVI